MKKIFVITILLLVSWTKNNVNNNDLEPIVGEFFIVSICKNNVKILETVCGSSGFSFESKKHWQKQGQGYLVINKKTEGFCIRRYKYSVSFEKTEANKYIIKSVSSFLGVTSGVKSRIGAATVKGEILSLTFTEDNNDYEMVMKKNMH